MNRKEIIDEAEVLIDYEAERLINHIEETFFKVNLKGLTQKMISDAIVDLMFSIVAQSMKTNAKTSMNIKAEKLATVAIDIYKINTHSKEIPPFAVEYTKYICIEMATIGKEVVERFWNTKIN